MIENTHIPKNSQSNHMVLIVLINIHCIYSICSTTRVFILSQLNLIYSKHVFDSRRLKTSCALTSLCALGKQT